MLRKLILCAVIAVAVASPSIGLAGHHDDADDNPRPNAPHDRGWHKGWYKHHDENDYDEREQDGSEYHHHYDHSRARIRDSSRHWYHQHDLTDQNYQAACDEDGDNCHLANERYWGGYDYGPPVSYYQIMPPSVLNFTQQREWLLQRRQRAYQVLAKMRARADREAANRMQKVVDRLNAQVARDNQRLDPARYPSAADDLNPSNPFGSVYNPNYGTDPPDNALSGIVGPLLGLPEY